MRQCISVLAILAAALVPASTAAAAQQLAPPGTGGVAALDHALARLSTNMRVLVIGAHPDDEDTELLTLLSRGMGADAAYLSLSRGEGGQNLIGPELGEALGLIRTGELQAARTMDGGRQFFTRSFDFGYSKSLEETLRFWPVDTLLRDAYIVVRRFRPQIIVSVFSGTPRDGHGQHMAAGVTARRVFELLRDSAWGPKKLYRGTFFDQAATTLTMASGMLDPSLGQSYHQIALASRSLHRSQDMGRLLDMGPSQVRMALVMDATRPGGTNGPAGRVDGPEHFFEGINTALPPGLARYGALVDSARGLLVARDPGRIVQLLREALAELRQRAAPEYRVLKEQRLMEALALAAGVVVDASSADGRIVAGQAVPVRLAVWNSGRVPVELRSAALRSPAGWVVRADSLAIGPVASGSVSTVRLTLTPGADAALSEPYFLTRPRRGALYDWSGAPDSLLGEPFEAPLVIARFEVTIAGAGVVLEREVSHRFNDQARGEIRKPLTVVPAVGVAISPEVMLWPLASREGRTVTVELVHGAAGRTEGELRLEVPAGWPEVPPQRFVLEREDTRRSFSFVVLPPRSLAAGSFELSAVAVTGGRRFERGTVLIDYPHIRPVAYTRDATVKVEVADLALPQLSRLGYVRGASDMVPEALLAVGLPVSVLSGHDLERGDLSGFDVIVVGSRAYETDPALVANNGRLLDYVRSGGRLIVQYQQYQFVQGGFAPYRLEMSRPHDRVTDESSPVTPLNPSHPLFQTPNVMAGADWNGWVQERGLYFARQWDPAWRPLIEMGDPGERLQGGVLLTRLGQGLYVYTGVSFFRQLPAGVPGAYRLFMNLLGLVSANVP